MASFASPAMRRQQPQTTATTPFFQTPQQRQPSLANSNNARSAESPSLSSSPSQSQPLAALLSSHSALTAPLPHSPDSQLHQRLCVIDSRWLAVLRTPLTLVDLDALRSGTSGGTAATVHCEPPLPRDAHTVQSHGKYLLVQGTATVTVIKLPRTITITGSGTIQCRSYTIGEYYQRSSQSFRVLHCQFHPLSQQHLLVMTNDNMLRVYDLHRDIDIPEQTISLQSFCQRANVRCFALGSANIGWERFTVFVALSNGEILTVCPVVPNGISLPKTIVDELIEQSLTDDSADKREVVGDFIRETFVDSVDGCESAVVTVSHTVNDTRSSVFMPQPQLSLADPIHQSHSQSLTSLVCLNHSGRPVRLVRMFNSGRVDSLVSITPIEPSFLHRAYAPPPLAPIIAIDTATITTAAANTTKLVLRSSLSLSDVVVMSPSQLTLLTFPYFDQLTQELSYNHSDNLNSVKAIMKDAACDIMRLDNDSHSDGGGDSGAYVSGCVIDDSVDGRLVLAITDQRRVIVRPITSRPHTLRNLIVTHTNTITVTNANIEPFATIVKEFQSKYQGQNFRVALPPIPTVSVSDSSSVTALLQYKQSLSSVIGDCHSFRSELDHRVDLLSSLYHQSQSLLTGVDANVVQCMAENDRLRARLTLHRDIQSELVKRITAILKSTPSGARPLSDAELAFHFDVREKYQEFQSLENAVRMAQGKAAQLSLMMGDTDRRDDSVSVTISESERAKIQARVRSQTEELARLMEVVKTLKSAVQ